MGSNEILLDILSGDWTASLEERGAAQKVWQRGSRSARPLTVHHRDSVEDDIR